MKHPLKRTVIRRELSALHVVILITSNLFIGAGLALLFSQYLLPYSYPLIILGVLVLLPFLYVLTRAEKSEEDVLKKG